MKTTTKAILLLTIFSSITICTSATQPDPLLIDTSKTLNTAKLKRGLNAIDINEIKTFTIELSSGKYQGRETDTEGNRAAARYIDSTLKSVGYNPVRQNFYSQRIDKNVSNILARIEGRDTNSFVIIGAHYDGLGIKEGEIYYGADDNISGVAAVMTLARMYRSIYKEGGPKPDKTVIFAFWDREEVNIMGSNYFVSNFYKPERISLYMNFDMVGRANNGEQFPEVSFAWNNNYPQLKTLCVKYLHKVLPDKSKSLDITYEVRWGDGKGGSDYAGFSRVNIPYIAWMEVKMHEDYHKPTDTSDKLSWSKLERVIRMSFFLSMHLTRTF